MDTSSGILEQLALKRAINRQLDRIIVRANETVTSLEPSGKDSEMEENQIRNVVNVSSDSRSVEVVTNFIRYQIGRSRSGKQWQYGRFGERVIQDIEVGVVLDSARLAADRAAKEIAERDETADRESLFQRAYINLTLLYLGYLSRAFRYCKEANGWDRLRRKENRDVS